MNLTDSTADLAFSAADKMIIVMIELRESNHEEKRNGCFPVPQTITTKMKSLSITKGDDNVKSLGLFNSPAPCDQAKNRNHFYEYSPSKSSESSEMLEVVWTTYLSEISFAKFRRRSVTAWDHIFSDHIFSDNIFSDFDEYEDLKASKLGVFIKFKELGFGWTSRLVHFIFCFQLDIKKKFELWSLVVSQPVRFSLIEFEHLSGLNCDYIKDLENPRCEVTKEMAAFWEKMGVDLDTGSSIEQITEAFYRCDEWSRDDRKRLGYLAIYAGYIEGKKFSTATRASLARLVMDLENFENYPWGRVAFKVLMDSLKAKDFTQTGYTVDGFIQVIQVWAYYAMQELGANYGSPVRDRPSPLLLAYKGGQGRHKFFKSAINRQINVNNFVQKDLDEMFPEWDGGIEDPAADNIIKVMFNDPGWKWTMDCWQVTGTHKVVKMEVSPVKNEEKLSNRKLAFSTPDVQPAQ
ncbi:hypothetical protein DY000_02020272 [Brassica cretica]|uniref:DUF1985 domain-containing protein n=1 Tax=Brassica cretica TaxID=69181 RepID=A0ABQ7E9U5_BRACR|nr:hypothetical protein DY000_02020272 [Brassica cretica]